MRQTLSHILRYELLHAGMLLSNRRYMNIGVLDGRTATDLRSTQQRTYQLLFDEIERSKIGCRQSIQIVEIGAGLGDGFRLALEHPDWHYQAIDISWLAMLRGGALGTRNSRAAMQDLPLADGSIDAACAIECLCVVPWEDRRGFLRELRRVLTPDGLFFSIDFFPGPPLRAREDLETLCADIGLQIRALTDLTGPARHAIEVTEHERPAAFARLPGFVRRSAFGDGLRETLILAGSRKYDLWQTGQRSYVMSQLAAAH